MNRKDLVGIIFWNILILSTVLFHVFDTENTKNEPIILDTIVISAQE